jgi:hypothetical protein
MTRIFVSYSRVDKNITRELVELLRQVFHHDNVWWDDELLGGHQWWKMILSQVAACDIFLYLLSNESVTSPYCQAEFSEAQRLQKRIVTVQVRDRTDLKGGLDDIQYVDMKSGINDVKAYNRLIASINYQMTQVKPDLPPLWAEVTPRPGVDSNEKADPTRPDVQTPDLTPATSPESYPPSALPPPVTLTPREGLARVETLLENRDYAAAIDLLEKIREIPGYSSIFARAVNEMMRDARIGIRYLEIADLFALKKRHIFVCDELRRFRASNPTFEDYLNLEANCSEPVEPPPVPITSSRERLLKLMPAPFDMVPIPAGSVTLGEGEGATGGYISAPTTVEVDAFAIAKYPVTNAQFKLFIDAGGYKERRYWTNDGWGVRESETWTEPRYWTDSKWNDAEYPVVGISWYEVYAYCQWLAEMTGAAVRLPTDAEWQRAAQGARLSIRAKSLTKIAVISTLREQRL